MVKQWKCYFEIQEKLQFYIFLAYSTKHMKLQGRINVDIFEMDT